KALGDEERTKARGDGGASVWDRATRFLQLRKHFEDQDPTDPDAFLSAVFDEDVWIGDHYAKPEPARLDMRLLRDKAKALLAEIGDKPKMKKRPGIERLAQVAKHLRYQIAPREPFDAEDAVQVQVATLWGAKGVTADHVYLLGTCEEAIPGARK